MSFDAELFLLEMELSTIIAVIDAILTTAVMACLVLPSAIVAALVELRTVAAGYEVNLVEGDTVLMGSALPPLPVWHCSYESI